MFRYISGEGGSVPLESALDRDIAAVSCMCRVKTIATATPTLSGNAEHALGIPRTALRGIEEVHSLGLMLALGSNP